MFSIACKITIWMLKRIKSNVKISDYSHNPQASTYLHTSWHLRLWVVSLDPAGQTAQVNICACLTACCLASCLGWPKTHMKSFVPSPIEGFENMGAIKAFVDLPQGEERDKSTSWLSFLTNWFKNGMSRHHLSGRGTPVEDKLLVISREGMRFLQPGVQYPFLL